MKPQNKYLIFALILLALIGGGFWALKKMPKRQVNVGQTPVVSQDVCTEAESCATPQQSATTANNTDQQQAQPASDVQTQTTASDQNNNQQNNVSQVSSKVTNDNKPKAVDQNIKTNSSSNKIIDRLVSWGFQKSAGRTIDTIIVHTSYDAVGSDPYGTDGVIAEWKAAGVAPHYLISRDGTIFQLVADQNIAWHAGVSKMPDGRTNVNDFSLGVEMINTQDGKFADVQYNALNYLIKYLKGKYAIKYVLGHDDIAPGRKTDPWGMDWSRVDR